MLQALTEREIRPDLIIGTSIGAINGALFASDPTASGIGRLTELWNEVAARDLLGAGVLGRLRTMARLKVAVGDPQALREVLERAFVASTFAELQVRFECVASSIERAAEHWFNSGDLIPALLATAAVPALFPPVQIDGEHYYDGGLVNSVPVDRAIELGATELYVLQVGRLEQPLRAPKRLHEVGLVAFEIARRHRFQSLRNKPMGDVDIHVLPSAHTLEFDDRRQLNWSDLDGTATLIDDAYRASADYLDRPGSG